MEKKEEIKDRKKWCSNCLQLSDIYLSKSHFSQTEYCLLMANAVLPPFDRSQGLSEMAMLQALVSNQLAKYYLEKLEFQVLNFKNEKKALQHVVDYKDLYLERFEKHIEWPVLKDLSSAEEALETRNLALKYFNRTLHVHKQRQALAMQNVSMPRNQGFSDQHIQVLL